MSKKGWSKERYRQWFNENRERLMSRRREYRRLNIALFIEKEKKQREAYKAKVIGIYGGKCACCGETHIEFLAIDHINGGGTKARKALNRRGLAFYRWLSIHKWPEGFRVLCFNCNFAIGAFGKCPHGNVMLEVKPKREEERQLRLVS